MPENTSIPDAELAEVKRRHAAATPGTWRMFYGGEPLLIGVSGELVADMKYPRDAEAVIALHNAFQGLLARLAAAERERDAARKENDFIRLRLAESDKACVYCDLPKAEMGACAHGFPGCARADDLLHCNELTRRDDQRRREGAAEWFAEHRDYNLSAIEQMEKFTQAAKRLRKEK